MKLEVNKIESLEDITVGQFQEWQAKMRFDKDGKPTIDERTQNSHALKIFCGIPYDVQNNTKAHQLQSLLDGIGNAFGEIQKFQQRFIFEGVEYGFIPKLDDITTGEYIDLEDSLNDVAKAHKAMATMYRPITIKFKDSYKIQPYTGTSLTADKMKQSPLSVYLGAQVFFWNLGIELSSYILSSSKTQEKEKGSRIKSGTSQRNGDGTRPLTQRLTTMLQSMKLSPRNH